MTAIGIVLFITGWLIGVILGSPNPYYTNVFDKIACVLYPLGFILTLAGVATWLWKVLP